MAGVVGCAVHGTYRRRIVAISASFEDIEGAFHDRDRGPMKRRNKRISRRLSSEHRIGAGIERLEPRCLLAFAPQLVHVSPSVSADGLTNFDGTLFFSGNGE